MTEASKRPWRVSNHRGSSEWIGIEIDEPNISRSIGSMYMFGEVTNLANANLIIRAVNNFDEMKDAIKQLIKKLEVCAQAGGSDQEYIDIALAPYRAVLAKIEE